MIAAKVSTLTRKKERLALKYKFLIATSLTAAGILLPMALGTTSTTDNSFVLNINQEKKSVEDFSLKNTEPTAVKALKVEGWNLIENIKSITKTVTDAWNQVVANSDNSSKSSFWSWLLWLFSGGGIFTALLFLI